MQLLKRAGLPDIRFHDLRHTTATLMLFEWDPPDCGFSHIGTLQTECDTGHLWSLSSWYAKGSGGLLDELFTPMATDWQQLREFSGCALPNLLIRS